MAEIDLEFKDFLDKFGNLGKGEWITAYSYEDDNASGSFSMYSALIPDEKVKESLRDPSWNLHIGDGLPGFSFYFKDGKEIGSYSRNDGIEPLVISRSFHGMKEGYKEILEEFRLYFNLYEDKRTGNFILIDDNGDDEEVILISEGKIQIKLRLVKEFLSVKKMHLALFFDSNRFSDKTLEALGIKEYNAQKTGDDFVYSIGARAWDGFTLDDKKSQGWIMGKKIIPGLRDFKPQMFDRTEKKFVDFIIGVDEEGKEITYTSEEDRLANYFGKNPGSPQFITPCFFSKDVLTKYYSQPEKFSVEDGYLRCGGMWGLRMDNNHPKYVMVFLGDLGHLSYKEQLYWKRFNVATTSKISNTAWSRDFEAQFTDPESSDLYFKQKFNAFQKKWKEKYGWDFFMPIGKEDEHYLKSLRIPLTKEQKEFDEQILALVKVFIDSLNEKELGKGLTLKTGAKGIDKLEAFLKSKKLSPKEMLQFLRNLQNLRSTGVAHLKGNEYKKIKVAFSIDAKSLPEVFDDILVKCIRTLNTLENRLVTNLH